jgi:hypothetical protein
MQLDDFIKLLKKQGIEEDLGDISDEFYAKWGRFFLQLDTALSSFIEAGDVDGYGLFIELCRRVIATKMDRYKIEKQMGIRAMYEDSFWNSLWDKDDKEK